MSASASTVESSSESEFLCLFLDDFCEEIELEGNKEEEQGSYREEPVSSQVGRKRSKSIATGGSKRKRKVLNKEEKAQVMLSIIM